MAGARARSPSTKRSECKHKRKKRFASSRLLDSMNRPLFRARNIDPSKRIRLLVDQHDSNNNDLTKSSKQSLSGDHSLVSHASTFVPSQTSQPSCGSTSPLPQRCVPQMPFVSGMEREEEAVEHRFLPHSLDLLDEASACIAKGQLSRPIDQQILFDRNSTPANLSVDIA